MNDRVLTASGERALRGGAAHRAWAKLRALARRRSVLAVADQAIVSGTSFLTTVLIGRFGHAEHLGLYSLGWSIVLALLAVQMSLMTTPYAVHHHRADVDSKTYAGSTMLMQLSMLLLVLLGLLVSCLLVHGTMRTVLWAIALAVPFLLLREFGRRMAYARLAVDRALMIDIPVVIVQIVALALLAWAGKLSAVTAFLALGVSAAVGTIVDLLNIRGRIAFRRAAIAADVKRNWGFGRWIAGAQLLGVVNTQGTFWLIAAIIGTASTGVYAACLAIVLLCNPFMLAVGNVLTPRAAETFARQGDAAMRRLIVRVGAMLAIVMSLFCILLFFWGDSFVQLLYGAEYAGHGLVIGLLGLTFLFAAVGMAINDGIRTLGRADIEFAAMLLDTVLTIGLGAIGLLKFGLVGLAWATLLGSVAALALQAVAFVRLGRTS